jgi:hypothetical protein
MEETKLCTECGEISGANEINKQNRIRRRVFALILTATGAGLIGLCIVKPGLSPIGVIIGMCMIFAGGNLNGSCEVMEYIEDCTG